MRRRQISRTQPTTSLARGTLARRSTGAPVIAKSYFFPTSIPGCQLWLDAADNSSLAMDGTNVTTWRDKSGNGYHMNTVVGSTIWSGSPEYPIIGTSINGLQTIKFSPQAGLKQSTTLDGVKNLFWVGRIAAATGSGTGPYYFLLGHDSHYDWHTPVGEKFILSGAAQDGIANAFPASLFTSDANAVTNTAFSSINLPSPPNVSLLSVAGITGNSRYQGICYDRTTHIGWCGDLAEVLIFSTALTTSQRQTIEGYLAHKWGLTKYYSPTTPLTMSGCQLWLDAADSSTVTGTSTVTQWRDKSGNNRHLGVGAGTTSYSSNAIQLNSSYMFVNSPVDLSKVTVFMVVQSTGGVNKVLFGAGSLTGVSWDSLDGFAIYMQSQQPSIEFYGNSSPLSFNVNISTPTVFSFQSSGSSRSGWLNGGSQTNRALIGTRTSTARGFAIGAEYYNNTYNNSNATASIYEIIVYNSDFSIAQRETIEKYLMQKWGLGAIPSTHPYVNFPPASLNPFLNTFLPSLIPGCQLWLDAADSSTVTGTTTVTAWADKSGNNRHLGVGAGTTSYSSNTIQLNSSYMFVNSLVDLSKVTVFIVLKGTGQFNKTLFTATPISGVSWETLDAFSFYVSNQSPSVAIYGEYNSPLQINANALIPQVYSIQSSGTSLSAWYNGVSQTGRTLTSTRTSTARGFAIGAEYYSNTYNNSSANASFYELLVYNSALSTNERQQVESYLAFKWGLQASLPSDHSYKIAPPSV
jgi:hypothetical protein